MVTQNWQLLTSHWVVRKDGNASREGSHTWHRVNPWAIQIIHSHHKKNQARILHKKYLILFISWTKARFSLCVSPHPCRALQCGSLQMCASGWHVTTSLMCYVWSMCSVMPKSPPSNWVNQNVGNGRQQTNLIYAIIILYNATNRTWVTFFLLQSLIF